MYARLPHACVYMHIYAEISPPAVRKVILVSACMRTLATPESFQVCKCKIIASFWALKEKKWLKKRHSDYSENSGILL